MYANFIKFSMGIRVKNSSNYEPLQEIINLYVTNYIFLLISLSFITIVLIRNTIKFSAFIRIRKF